MNLAKSYEHIFSPGKDGSNVIRSPGILTFMSTPAVAPETKDLKEAKALFAFLGVPYDEGNIGKPGSVAGPHAMREASSQYFTYMFEHRVDLSSCCQIVDCGDVGLGVSNPTKAHERIYDCVSNILAAGAVPIICGGDHSVSIPAAHALSDHLGAKKKLGYLNFGAHLDMADSWGGEKITSVSAMARATELSNVDVKNVAHVGARNCLNPKDFIDLADERGVRYFPMWEIFDRGIGPVLEEAADLVWDNTDSQYVTFNMNVMDASCAPGVTAPEPAGLEAREVLRAARIIGGRESVGIIEIAELCPVHDSSLITSKLAVCIVHQILGMLAVGQGCQVDPSIRKESV